MEERNLHCSSVLNLTMAKSTSLKSAAWRIYVGSFLVGMFGNWHRRTSLIGFRFVPSSATTTGKCARLVKA
jgi:hypothetical protein